MPEWVCMTALNAKTKGRRWHRMLSWTMALNAKMKTRLWMPKTNKMNGSECLKLGKMALNAYERKLWLWMPKGDLKAYNSKHPWKKVVALNAKNDSGLWIRKMTRGRELKALNAKLTKCQADCSKCQTEDMMALNTKLTNGSECLTMNDGSEC